MDMNRLGYVDVGARGGVLAEVEPYIDRLHRVLVEPEPQEFERLVHQHAESEYTSVIGIALAAHDGMLTLNQTANPTCSSALAVNAEFINQYSVNPHFMPAIKIPIPCARYDSLYETQPLPLPHVLKIDVQGYEYQVLEGFGDLLHETLAITLESHFYPLYKRQKLLGDLIEYLDEYGFALRKISNPRSPNLNGDHHFDGDLVEVDATFTKRRRWARERGDMTLHALNFACQITGAHPY